MVLLVTLLTALFWIPGAIAAMFIVVRDMQRMPPPMEERSRDVFGAAQNFKSQPLSQTAASADPFASPKSPSPLNSLDKSANNLPASPPTRPKPPWES